MEDIEEIAVATASVFKIVCKSRYVNLTYGFCISSGFYSVTGAGSRPVSPPALM